MKNIFVSRPSWVSAEFEEGLNTFLRVLKSHDLTPRTLGSSDFPHESPLNHVIEIMHECSGAIILGYPQITVKEGDLKGDKIENDVVLGTEWNHMEAALAYSQDKPLLVIHHETVTRGVFDKGTLNSFLHAVDLTEPNWSSAENIIGAFKTWKKRVGLFSPKQTETKQASDFVFEERSGAYLKEGTDLRYCSRCMGKDTSKEVPLRKLKNGIGWECPVCDYFFEGDNYQAITRPTGGGY
jgi:hypothetical protein